jgi:hypothetical protein
VAAALKRDSRFEVEMVEGRYGELTVLVEGEPIISSGPLGFIGVLPSVRKIRDLVEQRVRQRQ